ncbi:MAG: NADH-quinone oxidoreductase subunit J [Candidatus Hatepunaea meridiana]|nr:NADH-quinone oxidoreductase subunit J [Candidatus Hatepunaea meridiana]
MGSAAVVVFHSRIIYSAFALLFTFVGVGALYLYLSADFLAASQLLIYVGAILTLIIFGVFLTTKVMSIDLPEQSHQRFLALIPITLIGIVILWVILQTPWAVNPAEAAPTTKELGRLLMSRYLVPFELASVLLLAALIGAMRLARYFKMEE